MSSFAKLIIIVGIALIVFGVVVLMISHLTGGKGAPLPGDIVVRRYNTTIYFPIVTSVVVSIILTIVLWIISAFRR